MGVADPDDVQKETVLSILKPGDFLPDYPVRYIGESIVDVDDFEEEIDDHRPNLYFFIPDHRITSENFDEMLKFDLKSVFKDIPTGNIADENNNEQKQKNK